MNTSKRSPDVAVGAAGGEAVGAGTGQGLGTAGTSVRAALAALLLSPVLGIVGCASTGGSPGGAAANADAAQAENIAREAARDSGTMYQVMAAELALQQGDVASAYATYLSIARRTRDAQYARRATEIALGARALQQALDASRLWVELDPKSSDARQATGALLVAGGQFDEAAALYAEQLKTSASPAEELARVQRVLARAADRAAGMALLTKLAQPYRDDPKVGPEVRLTLSGAAFAAGDTARAVQEARDALALKPDFERAALVAAQLLARPEGKDDDAGRAQAQTLLADFLARNPKAPQARVAYARLLVGERKYGEARAQFEQVVRDDENNLDGLYALGVLSIDQPSLRADARRYLERWVKLVEAGGSLERDPDPAYLNLARLAEDERRYGDALQWLDKVDDGEQYFIAVNRKALVLGKMKRVDEARKLLAATTADNEAERVQLVLTEGQLLRDAGRYKEAFQVLDGALKKSPDDAALLYDAAMAAEKLNRLDVMEAHLRRVMVLKPDDAHAYNALGYTLADRNVRLPEAYALIDAALKLAPDDGYILDSMGWVYYRMGNLAKAREFLQKAYDMRPHAEVGAHLGEVLWVKGERDAARKIWRESQTLEPDNETLSSTLRRLKVRL